MITIEIGPNSPKYALWILVAILALGSLWMFGLIIRNFKEKKYQLVSPTTINPSEAIFLQMFDRTIESHFEDGDFSVETVGQDLGLSRTALFKKVKNACGQTVIERVRFLQMREAKTLLRNRPGLSVSEIAYLVGFKTPGHFSRVFRQFAGVSPTVYREENTRG